MTTNTEDPAGRWHTVPYDPDADVPQAVEDAEEDSGEGLDGVVLEDDPSEEGTDDGA